MTITYEGLQEKFRKARIDRDKDTAQFYSTLIGDLQTNAKVVDGEKVITDEQTLMAVRQYLKNTKEILSHGPNPQASAEQEILESFLPAQMTEEALREAITQFIEEGNDHIGKLMGKLKAAHGGTYDGAKAAQIAKELL